MSLKAMLFQTLCAEKSGKEEVSALLNFVPPAFSQPNLLEKSYASDVTLTVLLRQTELIHQLKSAHYSHYPKFLQGVDKALQPLVYGKLKDAVFTQFSMAAPIRFKAFAGPTVDHLVHEALISDTAYPHEMHEAYAPILELNKQSLCALITYFGLYDLSNTLPMILDKSLLKGVYSALNHKQKSFLGECLRVREKDPFPKFSFKKWKGGAKQLQELLHKRGLVRFAHATMAMDQNAVSSLLHTLDTGRSTAIEKIRSEKSQNGGGELYLKQLNTLIHYLTQKSKVA